MTAQAHHSGGRASKTSPRPAPAGRAGNGHYTRLYLMTGLSFLAMFVLMYAMVDIFGNVFLNLNQVYMAGLMAAAMLLIELALMGAMYPDKRRNTIIAVVGIVALLAFWFLIRSQAAITDKQFLRSMIPHHASALLMCEQADLQDPEIKDLCGEILSSQQEQIDQMRTKLEEME